MTSFFAFYKESRAASIAREYEKLVPRNAKVIRECDEFEVPAEDLVLVSFDYNFGLYNSNPSKHLVTCESVISIIPNGFQGDILVLRTGDIVPADCRILESSDGFMVDNSAITGESEPIELDPTATHEKQLFSRNMAFFSATVVRGRAKAVVTRTVCTVWKIVEFSST